VPLPKATYVQTKYVPLISAAIVKLEVLVLLDITVTALQNVLPCGPIDRYACVGGTCSFHLHIRRVMEIQTA
jgi:hypothetical protein